MSKYAENALREIRAYIEANYGKLSPEALLQELFAHRFAAEQSAGLRAAALKNENASWLAKVADAAKRLWRSFGAALGGNRIDAKTLSALSPDEAMRRLAEGMARGQTLGRAPNGRGAKVENDGWGDVNRRVKIVGDGVASWKYVKGTKVSEHKVELEKMAYANVEAQPNHEIDKVTGGHCLVIDGTKIRISKSGLFHGADRRLQNIGNAIANIGDILNASISVPNTEGEYSYRIAETNFGRPEFVLVTLKNVDGQREVVDLKRVYSVNVKADNAAQSLTSTSIARPTENIIANLRDAWQRMFKPGIDAHNAEKQNLFSSISKHVVEGAGVSVEQAEDEIRAARRGDAPPRGGVGSRPDARPRPEGQGGKQNEIMRISSDLSRLKSLTKNDARVVRNAILATPEYVLNANDANLPELISDYKSLTS